MHKSMEKKQFSLETYETLVAFNGDILFEWNLENDRFYTTPNLFDIFGYLPPGENFTATLEKSENIHPDDKKAIKEYLNNIQFTSHDLTNRKYYSKMEIRIKNIYRKYVWCKLQLVANYSPQNMPFKISGMITNIDFDKKHQENLITQAQKDLLTGLYNKATTQKLIDDWMSAKHILNKAGVLILIDLDGFKAINDHFGHLFGDAVISDTATIIKSHFLTSDIAGRIGGDEFIVFLKEFSSVADLKNKLNVLIRKLARSYFSDNISYAISASIGISLYPAHGKDYEELFAKADQALYYIKQHGKNEFMFYRNKLPKTLHEEKRIEKRVTKRSFDENLIEYIFKILYSTKDHQAAIEMLLALLGKKLNLSRTFIYLRSTDGKYYTKAFEWCNSGIPKIDTRLTQIDTHIVEDFYRYLDQDNLLICNHTKELTNENKRYFDHVDTKAFMHARMIHDNEPRGCVGFDECHGPRDWTAKEISLLNFLTDVLMAFIHQQDLENKLAKVNDNFLCLLNTMNERLYIVDPVTHELIYLSDKMKTLLDGTDEERKKCFQHLYQINAPCSHCPAPSAMQTSSSKHILDEVFDEKTQTHFHRISGKINWPDGRECCLIKLEHK